MKPNSSRSVLMTVTMLMVFVFSAMLTVPAYADDSTPPPTETPTEVTPPVDESTPAAIDPALVTEETVSVEETVAELLTQVPEGTELVVVNDEGETVPLVTQEAADAVAVVDPVWCPTGVAPKTDGTGGCTFSYDNLKLLVDNLMAGTAGVVPAKNGVIWIQSGGDLSSGAVLLDGLDVSLGTMETFSLTLQGGWDGMHGSIVVNAGTPSTFTHSISITNWLGDITLNNITLSGVTVGSASNSAALNIQTSKKITLTNVKVNNNSGVGTVNGAVLDNADADPFIFGNVSITNGQFNNNKNKGLQVFSEGTITLANVLVKGNGAGGATLDNSNAATAKAVTIVTGTNEFSNNGGTGLDIDSKGAVALKDITVTGNSGNGAMVENHFAATPQPVTLTGTNVFSDNTNFGLRVNSIGVISASNLIANGNAIGNPDEWGVYLRNNYSSVAQAVKLTGNNEFKFNGNGLFIWSNGAITTNNVVATDSTLERGAVLWNNIAGFSSSVTMTGVNIFTDNAYSGLEIYSMGNVILNNIKATGNGFSSSITSCSYQNDACGAYLDNSQAVTPMPVTLNGTNTFNNNLMTGLEIHSKGVVTLNKVTASDNINGFGTLIQNESAALPKAVTLNGFGVFNNNLSGGLRIITKGAVTLNNVTANENHNSANTAGGNGVLLDNTPSTSTLAQNITLKGVNQFNGNYLSGLDVKTYGVVLLSNVTAKDNSTGYGALIHNELGALHKAVTLTGYGIFNNNSLGGLYIYSRGAITLINLTANDNTGRGVTLVNTASTPALPQNVTINGTNNFNRNSQGGLIVVTYGAILTNNLTANDNLMEDGVYLYNYGGTISKSVTLNGVNTFNNNGAGGYEAGGLTVYSLGAITISKVEANNNHNVGVYLNNRFNSMPFKINITGWVYVDNNNVGLYIDSTGDINVANLNINKGSFQEYGVLLFSSLGNIVVSGASQIFDSASVGLKIITEGGAVTLSNLTVSGNGLAGVFINTTGYDGSAEGVKGVTLTGLNTFWDNGGYGLQIITHGAIAVSNIDAYNNSAAGVYLDNCGASSHGGLCDPGLSLTPKAITITGSNFFEKNGTYGLHVLSFGAISISNLHSTNNITDGAYINNQWDYAASGITLTGINSFADNGGSGLVALSNGAINMSNVTADSNDENGVWLANHGVTSTTVVAVTLTGVNTFTNNGTIGAGIGLMINAGGSITLSNVTSSGNQASGAILDNITNTSLLAVKPGVKLTGLNIFNHNGANGLDIESGGSVDVVNITAGGNSVDGIYTFTNGTITMACGSMNSNAGKGWNLTAGGLITLKGVFGFGNTSVNFTSSTPVFSRTCPVPAPVVIPPKDDSDEQPHGSNRTPPVYNPYDRN